MADESQASLPPARPAVDEARLDRKVEPEYAAISIKAVFALVFAGLGVVAFLPEQAVLPLPFGIWFRLPILIVIPLATIPLALAAVRDVRKSAGTKVGLGLAQAALALAALIALGAAAFHVVRQHSDYSLHQALIRAADGHLDRLLGKDYRGVFDEMMRNNPKLAEYGWQFDSWRRGMHEHLYSGGPYYGRKLEYMGIFVPESPEEGLAERGLAVYRLLFERGGVDLKFRYEFREDQWRLTSVEVGAVPAYPEPDATPRPRWE